MIGQPPCLFSTMAETAGSSHALRGVWIADPEPRVRGDGHRSFSASSRNASGTEREAPNATDA
jgi:hypothetical protein